jgi:hypothetical protein
MGSEKREKCINCGCLFTPDYRNRNRQKYCDKPECRKASKIASQKKWFAKPENKTYFSGPENVKRVQEWRQQNPDYSKRSKKKIPLQDSLNVQPPENKKDNTVIKNSALQDLLNKQPAVIIGLISNFIGSPLQDDIAETLLRMQQFGQDILFNQPEVKGGSHDCKSPDF